MIVISIVGVLSTEEAVSSLARALVPLEEHLNTVHTKEEKIIKCWYCNIVPDQILWVHLLEHLNNVKNPTTPDKAKESVGPTNNPTPEKAEDTEEATTSKQGANFNATEKTKEEKTQAVDSGHSPAKSSKSISKPPDSPADESKPAEVSVVKKGPVSPPPEPERQRRPSSPMLTIAKAPEELAASTIPFSSFFQKKSLFPKDEEVKIKEHDKPPEPAIKPPEPKEKPPPSPEPILKPPEPVAKLPAEQPEEKLRRSSGEKPKISLSEYAKKRQMSGDKQVRNKDLPSPVPVSPVLVSQPNFGSLKKQETPPARFPEPPLLSIDNQKPIEKPSPVEISNQVMDEMVSPKEPGRIHTRKEPMRPPTPLDRPVTPTITPSPDAGSSRSTTPGDRISRPTTPLDWPTGTSRRQSTEGGKPRRLSESYYKDKPRPVITEEMERQIIYGRSMPLPKRTSSVSPNQDKEKSASPDDRVKEFDKSPVEKNLGPNFSSSSNAQLTPEPPKTESISPEDKETFKSPEETQASPEAVDPEKEAERAREARREKRKQEEKDKLARAEKLAAVRKEIELRLDLKIIKKCGSDESKRSKKLFMYIVQYLSTQDLSLPMKLGKSIFESCFIHLLRYI